LGVSEMRIKLLLALAAVFVLTFAVMMALAL
jgi:hypothetical protein